MNQEAIKTKKVRILVFLIHAVSVLSGNLTGAILPDISNSLIGKFENTELYAKIIHVSTSLGIAVISLFIGFLDKKFERKKLIKNSIILFSLMNLIAAFSKSFESIIVFRFISGVFGSIMCVLSYSNVYSIKSKEDKLKTFAMISMVINAFYALAPFIGSFFYTFMQWKFLYIIPSLLALITLFFIDYECIESNKIKDDSEIKHHKIKNKFELSLVFVSIFLVYTNVYYILLKMPFILRDNIPEATNYQISCLILIDSITCIFIATQQSRISKFFSKEQLIVNAFICMSISYFCLQYAGKSYFVYSLCMIFCVIMSVPCVTNTASWIEDIVPKHFLSKSVSITCFTIFISSFSATFYGILLKKIFPSSMNVITACMIVSLSFSVVFYIYKKIKIFRFKSMGA